MKLVLYYDLEDAIQNVNEEFGPVKVVRNNRKNWLKYHLPIFTGMDYLLLGDVRKIPLTLALQFSLVTLGEVSMYHFRGEDPYLQKSTEDLKKLVTQLEDFHISTDFRSLKRAQVYEKKRHIEINEKKLPSFLEEKYVLVPTYGFHGEERNTSFLQEHHLGSSQYVLSIGSPVKTYEFRRVYG